MATYTVQAGSDTDYPRRIAENVSLKDAEAVAQAWIVQADDWVEIVSEDTWEVVQLRQHPNYCDTCASSPCCCQDIIDQGAGDWRPTAGDTARVIWDAPSPREQKRRDAIAARLSEDWTVLALGTGMVVMTVIATWLAVAGPACTIPCPAH